MKTTLITYVAGALLAIASCVALSGSAFASGGPFAYVTELNANRVTVIDVSTDTIVTTIGVGWRPREAVLTPDGQFVWVTNDSSGSVSIIEISSNTVVGTITGFARPVGVAFTPDGAFAYVVNFRGGRVSVVDTATRSIIKTIQTGNDSYGIVMLPSGTHAYVSNRGHDPGNIANHSVWVIDASTNTVVAKIPVGLGPHWLKATSDSSLVYVGAELDRAQNQGQVSVIDTATNTVLSDIATGGRSVGVALSPDEQTLYATNVTDARNVSVIDTTNAVEIATISDGALMPNPLFLAVTSDGKRIYVTNAGPSMVSVIDTATRTVVKSINVTGATVGIAITPSPISYICNGFFAPMDKGPVMMKKNRTLPLKAQLFDDDGNLLTDSDLESPPLLKVTYIPQSGDPQDVSDLAVAAGKGGDDNQFEFYLDQWRYNLKTKQFKEPGAYELEMVSGDSYQLNPACKGTFVVK